MRVQNTYRNLPKATAEESLSGKGKSWDFRWDNAWMLRMLPYIIYIAFFGIIYIANRHYTERSVRAITQLKKEVEELRVDYTTLNADFMYERAEDNILLRVKDLELDQRNKTQYKIQLKP
ncbi:MAG: FtsL-like putative cell division protein [Bernardetiaceae bacterium]